MTTRLAAVALATVSVANIIRADVYTITYNLSGGRYIVRHSDNGQALSGYASIGSIGDWPGMALGPNNTLYLLERDYPKSGFTLFDATTLTVKARITGTEIGGQQLFYRPGKMAVDSAGVVYAINEGQSSLNPASVQPSVLLRYDPANDHSLTRLVEWSYVQRGIQFGDSVGVGPDGKVLVSQGGRIMYGSGALAGEDFVNSIPSGYRLGGAFAFGPDGDLFALAGNTSSRAPSVFRFDGTSGEYEGVFVQSQFLRANISDLGFTASGDLLMLSQWDQQIYLYDGQSTATFIRNGSIGYFGLVTTGIPEPAIVLPLLAASGLLLRRRGNT